MIALNWFEFEGNILIKREERQKIRRKLDFSSRFSVNNDCRVTKITRQFHNENFIQECISIARDIFISGNCDNARAEISLIPNRI